MRLTFETPDAIEMIERKIDYLKDLILECNDGGNVLCSLWRFEFQEDLKRVENILKLILQVESSHVTFNEDEIEFLIDLDK